MSRPDPFPSKRSKNWLLLQRLVDGARITPGDATTILNISVVQARVAELRARGWPIRTMKVMHPARRTEQWDVYFFDTHFRGWLLDHPGAHPYDYPDSDGRGKFVEVGGA